MKTIKLLAILTAGFVASSASFIASASDEKGETGPAHWLTSQAASVAANGSINNSRFGTLASSVQASRQISVKAGQKWINVNQGETVKFTSGDKSFTWKFDTLGTPNFLFAQIVPTDFPDLAARVYVGANPAKSGS